MGIISATPSLPIYKQLVWVLGKLMEGIYYVLNLIHIQNTAVAIIIFTIILYTLMWPLMKKQQKFTRMSSMMNPEIQKIQKKYKGKRDAESMGKMQNETNAVYKKYGMSPSGGCVVSLIQFPILFALYSVIRNLPTYVGQVENIYSGLAKAITQQPGFQKIMEAVGTKAPIVISSSKYDYSKTSTLIDVLYKFTKDSWAYLTDKFPSLDEMIESTQAAAHHINNFFGLNIMESPWSNVKYSFKTGFGGSGWTGTLVWLAFVSIMIPVLAGVSQFISAKIMSASQKKNQAEGQMQKQMTSMLKIMPLISVWMGFTLPAYLGIYWVTSAVVRTIQAVIINRQIDKVPVEEMIEENKKKMEKKAARKKEKGGLENIVERSQQRTKNVAPKDVRKGKMSTEEQKAKLEQAAEKRKKAGKGSLSAGANLVQKFNENSQE